jgi:hypothetical protein
MVLQGTLLLQVNSGSMAIFKSFLKDDGAGTIELSFYLLRSLLLPLT